ncbi:MAG: exo-alpha-sialidase [Candidatus Aminicenantes bacterium]|nr:exo-alpha-sialidase [Candidatus Aminicenantes bacterium]
MKYFLKNALIILITLFLIQCAGNENGGTSGESSGDDQPAPAPTLSSISPDALASNLPPFTLTATGSNFVNDSKIVFDGAEKTTTYVSSTELNCEIETNDIQENALSSSNSSISILDKSVDVIVRNPSDQGGDSSSQTFSILTNPDFNEQVNVSNTNSKNSNRPTIAVDSMDRLHLAYSEQNGSVRSVYYANSEDGGESWSTPQMVSNIQGDYPSIAVGDDDKVHLVYTDQAAGQDGLKYVRSDDGGVSWTSEVEIPGTTVHDKYPSIAVDNGGRIFVAWEWWTGYSAYNIETYFSRSTNNGSSWSTPVNLSNNDGFSGDARTAVDDAGNVYVVWEDDTPGNNDIYLRRSPDRGVSWNAVKNVTANPANSNAPDIAVDTDGKLYLVYSETASPSNIYFKRSQDKGASWSSAKKVCNTSDYSGSPRIALDSVKNISVVWDENAGGYCSVYYSRSLNNGDSWTSFVDVDPASNDTSDPDLAVDSGGHINIACGDWTPMNNIYFCGSKRK